MNAFRFVILSAAKNPRVNRQRKRGFFATLRMTAMSLLIAMLASGVRSHATTPARFRLITLDPGHFHASLVQKFMYADVDPVVHVYASGGSDAVQHLKRIDSFNKRADAPTHW